ncbi:MAG: hypothetical protein ACK47B_27415, partial [Armatimonadota bacterium]
MRWSRIVGLLLVGGASVTGGGWYLREQVWARGSARRCEANLSVLSSPSSAVGGGRLLPPPFFVPDWRLRYEVSTELQAWLPPHC